MPKQWFDKAPPGVDLSDLDGVLIVVEGPDAVGRSEQIRLLSRWLEQQGYAVSSQVGLSRSALAGPELLEAKKGNALRPRTMALFYATDFYDQLENSILPALRAGQVVLADRYIYSLMARAIVRGVEPDWIASIYSRAMVPDAVYCLIATQQKQVERTLARHGHLDFWESGMDMGLAPDMFDSFIRYQRKLKDQLVRLQPTYKFELVNANRSVQTIHRDLRARVQGVLERLTPPKQDPVDGPEPSANGDRTIAPITRTETKP
jgi:dTMP kinase